MELQLISNRSICQCENICGIPFHQHRNGISVYLQNYIILQITVAITNCIRDKLKILLFFSQHRKWSVLCSLNITKYIVDKILRIDI